MFYIVNDNVGKCYRTTVKLTMWLNVMNINDQINYQKFIIVVNLYNMNLDLDFINEIYLNPDKPDNPQNRYFANKIDLNPDIPDSL